MKFHPAEWLQQEVLITLTYKAVYIQNILPFVTSEPKQLFG